MNQRPSLPKTKCSDSWYYNDKQCESLNRRGDKVKQSRCDGYNQSGATHSVKLPRVTWCLGDKPMTELLWCE